MTALASTSRDHNSNGQLRSAGSIDPLLKWPGGKRRLVREILALAPEATVNYIEPFLGGGAVFFAFDKAKRRLGSDVNPALINTYRVVRDNPNELIGELSTYVNSKEEFMRVRALDRTSEFDLLSPISKAARFIYLNKTGFNGLQRVNSNGQSNVPFGYYSNPKICDSNQILRMSRLLRGSANELRPKLHCGNYSYLISMAERGDFFYLDPPYAPIVQSSFTSYSKDGFNEADQLALRDAVVSLATARIHFVQSNSDTPLIRKLYSDTTRFKLVELQVRRSISANSSSRAMASELLIVNARTS